VEGASPHRFPDNQPGLFNARAGRVAARDHVKLALSRASSHPVQEKIKRCASDEQQARQNDGGDDWTRVSGEKRFERRAQKPDFMPGAG
jgi:hypothetical protein